MAIVGKPNVGKSTLFNRLVGKRTAIVDDTPGVTRDRLYGVADWRGKVFSVIDTGGFAPEIAEGIWKEMREQMEVAIEEADVILFLMDGHDGLTPTDREIANYLRKKATRPVLYLVNKIDSAKREGAIADFWEIGVDKIFMVSAEHGRGLDEMLDHLYDLLPSSNERPVMDDAISVAVVGRPNVGKSTLINRLLGEERLLTHDIPGTTRDAVDTLLIKEGKTYRFIDTAGIRKKSKTTHRIEKFSVIKALQAIERANITILIIDALDGPTDQDARVAGYALEKGKASVIVLNKWDLIEKETGTFEEIVKRVKEKLYHIDYSPVVSISAKTGQRVSRIFELINGVNEQHARRIPTAELNKALESAIGRHRPPVAGNKTIKFYYASQIETRPPRIAMVTNYPDSVSPAYERYLVNQLRETFSFVGTPIRLSFRARKGRHKRAKDF